MKRMLVDLKLVIMETIEMKTAIDSIQQDFLAR